VDKDDKEPAAIWDHERDMGITGRLLNDQERQQKIKCVLNILPRFVLSVWASRLVLLHLSLLPLELGKSFVQRRLCYGNSSCQCQGSLRGTFMV
jgi:hypothetical protein